MLRSSYNLVGFAQIRLRSNENMMGFAQIRRNSNGFSLNPTTIWFFFFAQISWVLHKSGEDLMFFCSDLVSFAQTQQRSSEKYRSPPKGTSGGIFVGFDRSDWWLNKSDQTWPVGSYGWWRVFLSETQCHRVDCGLGTDPTRTGPWTPLGIYMDLL